MNTPWLSDASSANQRGMTWGGCGGRAISWGARWVGAYIGFYKVGAGGLRCPVCPFPEAILTQAAGSRVPIKTRRGPGARYLAGNRGTGATLSTHNLPQQDDAPGHPLHALPSLH